MLLRFVDQIQTSGGPAPTVLLDLNNGSPWNVYDWDAAPPVLRVNGLDSFAADGSVTAGEAFSDRTISAVLDGQAASADAIAAAFQTLVRFLSAPNWLLFQPPGFTSPVFFRTKRCSPAALEEFRLLVERNRQVTLAIPAEPFAYGGQVAGAATVGNDPTATDGMRFTMPTVKGDVAAPLNLSCTHSVASESVDLRMVASASGFWQSMAYMSPGTTVSDASAIGGSLSRYTWTAGSGGVQEIGSGFIDDVSQGEYRVLARVRATSPVKVGMLTPHQTGWDQPPAWVNVPSEWSWIDLGVRRFPRGTMRDTAWTPAITAAAQEFGLVTEVTSAAAGQLDLDHVVVVPAPGADRDTATTLYARPIRDDDSKTVLLASGDSNQVVTSTTGLGQARVQMMASGGLPEVVPNRTNTITLARVRNNSITTVADDKTETCSVIWSYHPRYLYLRGD